MQRHAGPGTRASGSVIRVLLSRLRLMSPSQSLLSSRRVHQTRGVTGSSFTCVRRQTCVHAVADWMEGRRSGEKREGEVGRSEGRLPLGECVCLRVPSVAVGMRCRRQRLLHHHAPRHYSCIMGASLAGRQSSLQCLIIRQGIATLCSSCCCCCCCITAATTGAKDGGTHTHRLHAC